MLQESLKRRLPAIGTGDHIIDGTVNMKRTQVGLAAKHLRTLPVEKNQAGRILDAKFTRPFTRRHLAAIGRPDFLRRPQINLCNIQVAQCCSNAFTRQDVTMQFITLGATALLEQDQQRSATVAALIQRSGSDSVPPSLLIAVLAATGDAAA